MWLLFVFMMFVNRRWDLMNTLCTLYTVPPPSSSWHLIFWCTCHFFQSRSRDVFSSSMKKSCTCILSLSAGQSLFNSCVWTNHCHVYPPLRILGIFPPSSDLRKAIYGWRWVVFAVLEKVRVSMALAVNVANLSWEQVISHKASSSR